MHKSTVISLMAVPLAISAVPVEAYAQDTQATTEWKDVECPGWDCNLTGQQSNKLYNSTGELVGFFSGNKPDNHCALTLGDLEAGKKYRLRFPFATNVKILVNGVEIGGIDHSGNLYRGTYEGKTADDFIHDGWQLLSEEGLEFVAQEGKNVVEIRILHNKNISSPISAVNEYSYNIIDNGNGTSTVQRGITALGRDFYDLLVVNGSVSKKLNSSGKGFWAFFPSLQVAEVNQGGGEIVDPVPGDVNWVAYNLYQTIHADLLKKLDQQLTNFGNAVDELNGKVGGADAELETLKTKAADIVAYTRINILCTTCAAEDAPKPDGEPDDVTKPGYANAARFETDKGNIEKATEKILTLDKLRVALSKAVESVNGNTEITYNGFQRNYKVDIAAKCGENIPVVLKAINALPSVGNENYSDEDIANVDRRIDEIKASPEVLNEKVNGCKAVLEEIVAPLKEADALARSGKKTDKNEKDLKLVSTNDNNYAQMLDNEVDETTPVEFKNYRAQLAEFIKNLENPFSTASALSYEEMISTLDGIRSKAEVGYLYYANQHRNAIAIKISKDNSESAKALFETVQNKLNGKTFEGIEEITSALNSAGAILNTQKGNIEAVNDLDENAVANLKVYDSTIQAQINSLNEIDIQIVNYESADGLYKQLTQELIKAYENLERLKSDNAQKSGQAAEYFNGVIAPLETELVNLAGKNETMPEALTAGEVFTAYENKKTFAGLCGGENGFTARVDDLNQGITNTITAIEQNISKNKTLMDMDSKIRKEHKYIIDLIDALPQANQDLKEVQLWRAQLTKLLDEDLAKVTEKVTETYKVNGFENPMEGEPTSYSYFIKRYGELAEQINTDSWPAEYADAVFRANKWATTRWEGSKKNLDNSYRAGIRLVNNYVYGLTNVGYKEAMKEVGTDVNTTRLYGFRSAIDALDQAIDKYVKEQNAANTIFSETEFYDHFAQDRENDSWKLSGEISEATEAVVRLAKGVAEEYFSTLSKACDTFIAEEAKALGEQGILVENTDLATRMTNLENVKDEYDAMIPGLEQYGEVAYDEFILAMDGFSDRLDAVKATFDRNGAANTHWNKTYGIGSENRKELDDLSKELESLDKLGAKRDEYQKQFATKLSELGEIDNDWAALSADTRFENCKEYSDMMNDKIKEIRDLVAAAVSENDANTSHDKWQGVVSDLRNTNLKSLKEYCEGLAAEQSVADGIQVVEEAIDAMAKENVSDESVMDIKKDNIEDLIDDVRRDFRGNEIAALDKFIETCKIAYNDAQVSGNVLGDAAGYNKEFDRIKTELTDALDTEAKGDRDPENAEYVKYVESFPQTAAVWEKSLADMCAELQKLGGKVNDVQTTKDALEEEFIKVESVYTDAFDAYLNFHKDVRNDENDNKYAEFETRLNQIKADWENDRNVVVLHQENYKVDLVALSAEITALTETLSTASATAIKNGQLKAASDAKYAELTAEVKKYRDAIDAFETLLAGWVSKHDYQEQKSEENPNPDPAMYFSQKYSRKIESLRAILTEVEKDLEDRNNAIEPGKVDTYFNENSILKENNIESALVNYKNAAYCAYVGDAFRYADSKKRDFWKAVEADNIIDSVIESTTKEALDLEGSLSDLNAEHFEADGMSGEERYTRHEELRQDALGLADRFIELETLLKENTYLYGDVDRDGEVSVLDYQKLLSFIGEGKTFEEISSEFGPAVAHSANANGDTNKDINVADLSAVVKIFLNEDAPQKGFMNRIKAPAMIGENHLTLRLDSEENGVRRYAVVLDNADAFCNGQIDVKVSGNATIANVALADRAKNHELNRFDGEFGSERVIISSMENEVFNGNSGEILFIEVEGTGNVSVDNVIFADPSARSYNLTETGGTTFIDSIIEGAKSVKEGIYNAAGQAFDKIQRGINIIRHKDGKTTKEMHKK